MILYVLLGKADESMKRIGILGMLFQRLKLGAQHLIRLSMMTDIPAVKGRAQPVEQDHIDTY